MTGFAGTDRCHYANKPFNVDELALLGEKALGRTRLRREVRTLRDQPG
jgi:hypothetical protein